MDHGEHPTPEQAAPLSAVTSIRPFIVMEGAVRVCHCIEHHHVLDSGPNMAQYYDTHAGIKTDAIPGMWGFNHIQRSLLPPTPQSGAIRSIFMPGGGFNARSQPAFCAPIGLILGPVLGWGVGLLMFLAYGCSTHGWQSI